VNRFIGQLKSSTSGGHRSDTVLTVSNRKFLIGLDLDKKLFLKLLNSLLDDDLDVSDKKQLRERLNELEFSLVAGVLLKHGGGHFLFELDLNLFDELRSLEQRHLDSLETMAKVLRYIFSCLVAFDIQPLLAHGEHDDGLVDFLTKAYKYSPSLFKLQLKLMHRVNSKVEKYLKKSTTIQQSKILAEIVEKCFQDQAAIDEEEEEEEEINIDVAHEEEELDREASSKRDEFLLADLPTLLQTYEYTLSSRDVAILRQIQRKDDKLGALIFKLVPDELNKSDALNKQAKMSDFISLKLNEAKLAESALNFPFYRKLDDLESKKTSSTWNAKIYDALYLLPNIYHLLDYCELKKFETTFRFYLGI
jgi:hypothetical protein